MCSRVMGVEGLFASRKNGTHRKHTKNTQKKAKEQQILEKTLNAEAEEGHRVCANRLL